MNGDTKETLQFDFNDSLNDVVDALSSGDRVLVNDRSLPLTVFDTDTEKIGGNTHTTNTVYLEGRNGRVYRLRGSYGDGEADDSSPPLLELRRENKWVTKSDAVGCIELEGGQQILSDTRAGEWLQEAGIDVR